MNLAEGVQLVTFFILAVLMVVTAMGVVLLQNIVYSAFLLGGVFVSISGLYLLLNADFVAAAQILIYVGAVNVLILFAIMLVNKREEFPATTRSWVRRGATALVCAGLFALLSAMILTTPWSTAGGFAAEGSIVAIGQHFFSDYLLPFELASVLLLMAMVGAIVLARRDLIPDVPAEGMQPKAFTLQERPRELIGVGNNTPSVPEE
ncbi:NADH:ubiquinone oxidoreductase subunit 6 (chain J) [Rubidibacter lacunae KORDI 51-2]|uniref:NADH-quinone oxidoreductase subunit J n=1 Tax=Rubidibacter lacunae KORDI 51-2 TaxID=582515 RepID=U5DLM0_9CHRO|nr:NADH-quinone oxidoreductase subunit J [Rubidibacter lacunae]ERN41479.1 NADH:ubiquinone oxidoreductase subunit 6 (chain J) [Rubidibacter lacunae KORDI 51-2]